jgi:hypothetical protein
MPQNSHEIKVRTLIPVENALTATEALDKPPDIEP